MMRSLFLLLLSVALPAAAEPFIVDVEGGDGAVTLSRNGVQLAPQPLQMLAPGDEILVRAAAAAVSIDLGGGKVVRVEQRKSPYRVPAADEPTVLDNVIRSLVESYRAFVGSAEELVSAHSRGDPMQAPMLLCLAADENLVPAGLPLRAFWTHGRGPFRLTLGGQGPGATEEAAITAERSPARLADRALPVGDYRMAISDATGASGSAVGKVQVVPHTVLPATARDLLQRDWPQATKDRLLAVGLAEMPAWQYAALLHAVRADDAALVAGLFGRVCGGV